MRLIAIVFILISPNALAWNFLEPINTDTGVNYKSRFGNTYEYDLSRPSDQIKYQVDPAAQIRDQLDIDPTRQLERDLGQYGAGKINR